MSPKLCLGDIMNCRFTKKTYQEKNLVKNVLYTEDRSDELKASTPAKLLQPKSHIIKNDNSGS